MVTTVRHSCLIASALAWTLSAAAAERYEGIAYLRGTDHLAYRETDWLFMRNGIAERLTLYQCADGRAFARKRHDLVPDDEVDRAAVEPLSSSCEG